MNVTDFKDPYRSVIKHLTHPTKDILDEIRRDTNSRNQERFRSFVHNRCKRGKKKW